jgi:hypothetical protein
MYYYTSYHYRYILSLPSSTYGHIPCHIWQVPGGVVPRPYFTFSTSCTRIFSRVPLVYFPSLLPTSYNPGPPFDTGNLELRSNLIHTTSMRPLALSAPESTSGWPRDTDKSCIPRHVWWLRNGHCANVVKVKLHSVKLFQLHIAP